MQSLRDRNRAKHTKLKISISIIVLVLLLVLAPIVFPRVGTWLRGAMSPIWKLENNIGTNTRSFFAGFKSRQALEKENAALKQQLAESQVKVMDRDVLALENDSLKELLGRADAEDFILGTILTKPSRSVYDTLVIDAGSMHGVSIGAQVYAFGSIPLGTITSVGTKTSIVTLYSTAGQKTSARIEHSNIDVELLGRGGGNFELKTPRDVTLEPTMTVLLPGLKSHVVAVVAKSITDPRDPVQTFLLTSPVNINELNWVQVAK